MTDICLCAAKNIAASLQTLSEQTRIFCDWLNTNLNKIVKSATKSTGCLNRDKLWTEYYQLQISSVFTDKWKGFLLTIGAPTEDIFFQHCTRIMFDNLLKVKFFVHHAYDNQKKDSDNSFTTEEENAIRYVGGYVIFSLNKQEGDEEILTGLNHFVEKDRNEAAAATTSAAWVEEVDRGGLTRITEEVHQFFVALEGSVRSYLTLSKAHTMDDTTRSRVKSEVFADSDVQFNWCLTGIILKVGEDTAEELLEMCIDKWLTIRGYSFADSIQEIFKQQAKKGTAKAKALCKAIQ